MCSLRTRRTEIPTGASRRWPDRSENSGTSEELFETPLSIINSLIIQWLERRANHCSVRLANNIGFETVRLDLAGADLFIELSGQI